MVMSLHPLECTSFSESIDSSNNYLPAIDFDSDTHWVWKPRSNHTKVSAAVYHHLNQCNSTLECWSGWHLLWRIQVAPRLKYFIWICVHGRLSASAFLHYIRLGPDNPCILCGMHRETIDHLICHCIMSQRLWNIINYTENLSISFLAGFSSGNWITEYRHLQHTLAMIAAGAWFIWISRCNAIFKNISPNPSAIVSQTIAHVREFSNNLSNPLGKKLILNNFSSADGYVHVLFTHAITNPSSQVRSIGFFISNSNYIVSLAGCLSQSMLNNSLVALEVALQTAMDYHFRIKHIFCDHHGIKNTIWNPDQLISWRFRP
ncbi:Reverse transcriptase zinc-binding domain-containing protein [Dioscorea alata]|uniref:Reverse transcriptase zinc-binding domain-containing protein n=1 Tax=Dioscorea alata TaxID=55571 RepID=A0ACB7V146_DIOAL|nr:Reverse transcriptase zinc-binding domain-containing protein [Dioscorea alata]